MNAARLEPLESFARAANAVVRASGAILLVLGVLFWTGRARSWVGLHMALGLVLALALLLLAGLAVRARAARGLAALVGVWTLAMLALGMLQDQLLTGDRHWIVEVTHLVLGLGALGLGARLAAVLRRSTATPVGQAARRAEA
jgi:hypothetical protein